MYQGYYLELLLGIVLFGVLLVTIVDRFSPIFRTFLGDVLLQDYCFTSPLFFFQMMSSGGIR